MGRSGADIPVGSRSQWEGTHIPAWLGEFFDDSLSVRAFLTQFSVSLLLDFAL